MAQAPGVPSPLKQRNVPLESVRADGPHDLEAVSVWIVHRHCRSAGISRHVDLAKARVHKNRISRTTRAHGWAAPLQPDTAVVLRKPGFAGAHLLDRLGTSVADLPTWDPIRHRLTVLHEEVHRR